ncbi:MAG: FtsW/RodA/SpoVE family cell cycle protein [Chloroflexi bacterium]|nr:FtsW/RodA/SpoVE family cell cycle protein [Chloroflexota bacterium]
MTATPLSLPGSSPSRAVVRPRLRRRELAVLAVVALALWLGAVGLGSTVTGQPHVAGATHLGVYVAGLFALSLVLSLAGRRSDELLLPAAGMLGGVGLLLMLRLPQDLVGQEIAGRALGLADLQLLWLLVSLVVVAVLALAVRSDRWLRLYKYTWAAVGIGLLLLTFVFGSETNGARLTLTIGPLTGQPSELLKVILVVFFAGYLAEYRPILAEGRVRLLGPLSMPPVAALLPLVAMLGLALAIVVVQRDLGAALLYYAVFLVMLYVATGRLVDVLAGIALFLLGSLAMAAIFPLVGERIEAWLDPWADPLGSGYQLIQALHAFARGGVFGTGLGAGLPVIGGQLPIPAVHTDFPLAALGEEIGLTGVMAVLGLYLVLVQRGLRIAAAARDDFGALLATGLSAVVAVQAFIIAAGNLKLIPLTGITLPFVSYGGSSLLANALVVGLLLALSDPGDPVAPPPPHGRGRLARLRGQS